MTQPRACICDTPITDRYLCTGCTRRLTGYLDQLRDLNGELHIALSRMVRMTDHNGGRSADQPLIYSQHAAEQIRLIRTTLVSWIRLIAADSSQPLPDQATIAALATWLANHLDAISSRREDAPKLYDEIQHLRNTSQRVVDQPANRTCHKVGPCPENTEQGTPCTGTTWAIIPRDQTRRPRIECRTCGTTWWPEQWHNIGRRILARQGRTTPASSEQIRRLAELIS